jgi:hypothetical protein
MLTIRPKVVPVFATAKPSKKKASARTPVKPHELRQAIEHAKNLCFNYEDSIECRLAFERVEELSAELARQRDEIAMFVAEAEYFSEIETREYDV